MTTARAGHFAKNQGRARVTKAMNDQLSLQVGELADFSAALMVLAELAPDRMSLGQGVFFLLAAAADLSGRPARFSDIRDAAGPRINKSLHSTYRVFLGGERRRTDTRNTKGLGWLTRVENPKDNREKYLHLTPQGRDVIREVLVALTGRGP